MPRVLAAGRVAVVALLQRRVYGLMDSSDCERSPALCVCSRHAERVLEGEARKPFTVFISNQAKTLARPGERRGPTRPREPRAPDFQQISHQKAHQSAKTLLHDRGSEQIRRAHATCASTYERERCSTTYGQARKHRGRETRQTYRHGPRAAPRHTRAVQMSTAVYRYGVQDATVDARRGRDRTGAERET